MTFKDVDGRGGDEFGSYTVSAPAGDTVTWLVTRPTPLAVGEPTGRCAVTIRDLCVTFPWARIVNR